MSKFYFAQIKSVYYFHSYKFALSDSVAYLGKYSVKSCTENVYEFFLRTFS